MYWEARLTSSGMVPNRADDTFAVGYAHTGISGDQTARSIGRTRTRAVIFPIYERLLELSYMAHIVPGFSHPARLPYFWKPRRHVAVDPTRPGDPPVKDARRNRHPLEIINY